MAAITYQDFLNKASEVLQDPAHLNHGFVGKLKRAKKNKKPATTHKEIAELTENRISGSLFCRQFA
ncbi:MAG TPA: hypothetical protein PLA56_06620 [Nitrosomonas sp.]|nr:hypothetical protein [Nitrosomonas sp.]